MSCPVCGGSMVGDGHTTLRHCEFACDEDCEGKEADAGPVYCVEVVGGLSDDAKSKLGRFARECRANAGLPNDGGAE